MNTGDSENLVQHRTNQRQDNKTTWYHWMSNEVLVYEKVDKQE